MDPSWTVLCVNTHGYMVSGAFFSVVVSKTNIVGRRFGDAVFEQDEREDLLATTPGTP